MRHLQLSEGGPTEVLELSDQEAAALGATEIVEVNRLPGDTAWSVAPGRKVGVVHAGSLQVSVTPKIEIERLIFLMGYANSPRFWRHHTVHLDAASELPEALAQTFIRLTQHALEQGLLQGYRTVDDSLPVLRGRVRVKEQISRRFGAGLPLEVSYDEFTTDIAENQILLAATLLLLRMPALDRPTRGHLLRLRQQLAEIRTLSRGAPLPRWEPSRLNIRYQPALLIAEKILAGESFEQRVGDLHVSGFIIEMWKVFEDFVGTALRTELAPHGHVSLQHRMHMDHARIVDLRPDFLWTRHDGSQVVLDAKYKAEKPAGFPQADLYQMLAYCTVLGLREGHLIYAKGEEPAISHQIIGTELELHCHTLDLAKPPAELLAQIAELAERLRRGAHYGGPRPPELSPAHPSARKA